MRKILFALLALCTLLLVACGNAPYRQPPVTDDELNGVWLIRSAELGGKNFPAPGLELEIHGNEYRVSGPSVASDSGLIVLFGDELAGELRRMDVVGENGPNKGKRFPAIYRFAGNGRELEICYDLSQKDRPPEFVSRQGTMQFRVTYTRKQARKN